jgi:hypothetical protein
MTNRCKYNTDPFAYCHFENIGVLTTKTGLIKTLKYFYSNNEEFKKAGYTFEHTMAQSYVIPVHGFHES